MSASPARTRPQSEAVRAARSRIRDLGLGTQGRIPLTQDRTVMIVGAALVELHVHSSHSLKQKRGVVKSIAQRVRNRFNVSIAEVGGQETWQRAVLGLSLTGIDPIAVRRSLERTVDFIEDLHLAELSNSDVEIMTLPHENAPGPGDVDPLPWQED